MKKAAWMALAAMLALALLTTVVRAQEAADEAGEDEPQMVERAIKLPVKRYKVLGCGDVYRAANMNRQVDVRFEDALKTRVDVPRDQRTLRLGGRRYGIGLALRTRCGLLLLVPVQRRNTIEKLLGLPEDWPLNERTLAGDLAIRQGQKLTVEGTVLGNAGGEKLILADAVYAGQEPMPAARREVRVFWPGAEEIKSVTRPGSQKFEFNCRHVQDAIAPVTISVRQLRQDALLEQLALEQARRQVRPGRPAEALEYANFDPNEIYDHARRGDNLLVEFTDTVQRPLGRVPNRLEEVPAVRYGRTVDLPIGAAFRTTERLTCVVPANLPTPLAQVAGMVPGEKVTVRGQIIGEVLGEKVVRVDYLGFPDTEAADPHDDVWLVTMEWPSEPARTLQVWDFGRYRAMDLPCLHRRGASEAVQLVVRQYREVTVKVPAEAVEGEQDEDAAED